MANIALNALAWTPYERALPHDMERDIFTIAALYDRPTNYRLIFVARRVQAWLEHLLYISIPHKCTGAFLESIVRTPKPDGFYASHVNVLCISRHCSITKETLITVLTQFRGLEDLSIWINDETWDAIGWPGTKDMPEILAHIQPQKLSANLLRLSGPAILTSPTQIFKMLLFSQITHLEIQDNVSIWKLWAEDLEALACLSHLALWDDTDRGTSPDVLMFLNTAITTYKSLEVLFVIAYGFEPLGQDNQDLQDDPRFVTMTDWTDWEDPSREEYEFWAVAEDKVKSNREALENGMQTYFACDSDYFDLCASELDFSEEAEMSESTTP